MRNRIAIALVAATAVLVAAAAALGAAGSTEKYKLTANLKVRSEVPAPKAAPGATGLFTATLTESGSHRTIKWRLSFGHLTGAAGAAHIHKGKPGHAGPVIVSLCGPCRSGQSGTSVVTEATVHAIETGNAYVNVHTAKNAGGEVRGQVKESKL